MSADKDREKRACLESARFVKQNVAELVRTRPPAAQKAGDALITALALISAIPFFITFLVSLLTGSYSLSLLMLIIFLAFVAAGRGGRQGSGTKAESTYERKKRELELCATKFCEREKDYYACGEVVSALQALSVYENLSSS